MLIAQDLIFFASNVDCTRLEFGHSSGLTPLMPIWLRFEVLWRLEFISFLPEGLSKAFIRGKTLLHSAFLFQIGKHMSDAICYAMYDCAWMKCLCIGFNFMFFFSSNLPPFCPCILCRPVGAISLPSALGDIFVSIRACRIVSYLPFFGNETFLFKPLNMKHKTFLLYALDFTTLMSSINFAWLMKNY